MDLHPRQLRGVCAGCGQGVYSDQPRSNVSGKYYHAECDAGYIYDVAMSHPPVVPLPIRPSPMVAPMPDEASMPPGWEMVIDPEGKVFYIDHVSKTSHWEHPGMVTNHNKHAARQGGTAEAAANAKAAAEKAAAKAQARAAADEALAKAAAEQAAAQKAAAQKATAGNDNGGNDFSSASAQRYYYAYYYCYLCVRIRLFICPHTTVHVSAYDFSLASASAQRYYYIMCPHMYVSAYWHMCLHAAIFFLMQARKHTLTHTNTQAVPKRRAQG